MKTKQICLITLSDLSRLNNDFNFIGVGDGIWIPLSAPFLENGADNGLTYEEVLNGLLRLMG